MSPGALRAEITGAVLLPDDDGYDEGRHVFAAVGAPAAVVRPVDAADVASAVVFAAANELELSVRSGGHSVGGHSTNVGGLVVDLRSLDAVEVGDDCVVRIGAGATWGHVARELQPHGLALSSGDTSTVGVGGLTLGGGIGWLVRQHGLTIDSLLEAEVVTAAGDVVHASATTEPELFWALRGGGGNFGIVTRFTFRAARLPGIVSGEIQLSTIDLAPVLRGWRDAMRSAPEELTTTYLAMPGDGGAAPTAQVLYCYAGDDPHAAAAAIEPLLRLPGAGGHAFRKGPYADLLGEEQAPDDVTIVDHNAFVANLEDAAIAALVAADAQMGDSVLMIRSLGGAFSRVDPDATAFSFRDSEVLVISAAFLPNDAPQDALDRVEQAWKTLEPWNRGQYGNFLGDTADVNRMFPVHTLARLRATKAAWDPQNLFRHGHNIRPSSP